MPAPMMIAFGRRCCGAGGGGGGEGGEGSFIVVVVGFASLVGQPVGRGLLGKGKRRENQGIETTMIEIETLVTHRTNRSCFGICIRGPIIIPKRSTRSRS
jgi:hypothetical protein